MITLFVEMSCDEQDCDLAYPSAVPPYATAWVRYLRAEEARAAMPTLFDLDGLADAERVAA